jgi:hypothetical protein
MIDIETLGHKPGAVILSISAVQFDLETGYIGAEFHREIDIESCLAYGLEMDASTVMWWMGQDDDARKKVMEPESPRAHLDIVLQEFITWCALTFTGQEFEVWGNSNRFDLGILAHAYDVCDMKFPWNHRLERDVRTLVSFAPEVKDEEKFEGVRHYGIDDCKHQIKYCARTYQLIMG